MAAGSDISILSAAKNDDSTTVFSKKKTSVSLTGMAKQRELNGSDLLISESEPCRSKKRVSDAKSRELSGHDIFAPPPPEFPLKVGESTGNGGERSILVLSEAKLREMTGNDIFGKGEGAAPSRDYLGGVRKPPGGGSNITLL